MPSSQAICLYLETVQSRVHDLRAEVNLNLSVLLCRLENGKKGIQGTARSYDHSTPMFLRISLLPTDSRVFLVQLKQKGQCGLLLPSRIFFA